MSPDIETAAAQPGLDPAPLIIASRNWTRWVGPIISGLVLCAVLYQLRQLDFGEMWAAMPVSAGFWIAFVANYLLGLLAEWVIFRRLWDLPLRGLTALMRKIVSNELLLGYMGEVYFYAWARRNAQITAAPFGAVKDVAILSALAGNAVTLMLVVACWPFRSLLHLKTPGNSLEWSVLFVLVTSLAITLFRKRLFSLPKGELWMVMSVHLVRIFAMMFLTAYMWWCLLPDISLAWLMLLSTLRLLLSRLPFLPNKDLAFAGLAAFFVGHDSALVTAMALMASLLLATHLTVGGILGITELVTEGRSKA